MGKNAAHIIKEHGLRVTKNREAILQVFLEGDGALSHADVEQALNASLDRVTIYRTLNSFIEQGLIHKVLDDGGSAKFAICEHDHQHTEKHSDNHIHFKCENCGTIECLNEVSIPDIHLPKGYQIHELNFLVQGICKKCEAV